MAENRPVQLVDPQTIGKELQKFKGQIESALPRHITPDRMARIALTACRINPTLFRCTKESFFGAVITASQLGLEPNVNGQCYFVPYKNRQSGLYICTFIPGWRGLMDLVSRTGRATAWTQAAYDGDEFDYEYGSRPMIRHKPGKWFGEIKALTHTYAVGAVKGMEDWPNIEVWTKDKVWAHRDRNNKVGEDHYSFKFPEMYARKIPLVQVIKYLPSSVELNVASNLDIAGSEGRQRLTIEGAFSGDYVGNTEQDAEIEFLMEKLNFDDQKRANLRESYQDRPDELLATLKKEAAPLDNGKGHAQTVQGNKVAGSGSAKKGKEAPTVNESKADAAVSQEPTETVKGGGDREPQTRQEERKADPEPEQRTEPQQSMFGAGASTKPFKF